MSGKSSPFDLELADDSRVDDGDDGASLSTAKHPICLLISAVLFLLFLLVGIVTAAVGSSDYREAKTLYPSSEFQSPTTSVVALHWVFAIFAIVSSALFVWFSWSGFGTLPCLRLLLMVIGTLGSIACYISYLVMYFRSSEFKATGNGLTYGEYEAWKRRMAATNPQFEIDASWTDLSSYCYTRTPVAIQTDSSNDSSIFPDLSRDDPDALYHVFTTVTIELAPGNSDVYLENYKRQILENCGPWMLAIRRSATEAPGMLGLNRDQFVTASGELPAKLRRGPALAAGIFFAGVIHTYWVTAIPVINAYIIKTNVTLGRFALSCGHVYYTCNDF